MSRRGRSEGGRSSGLQKLLSEYYRSLTEIPLPDDFILREFAFQQLGGGFVRHLTFQSTAELREFLVKETPRNSYYSTALYRDPAAQRMEDKGLIFSELFFDIDVDHLPDCSALEYPLEPEGSLSVISEKCVEVGKQEQLKLLDVLTSFFGFSSGEIRVYFTGHRGFHTVVRPKDEDWLKLTSRQRRELVDFIKLKGVDKLLPSGRGKSMRFTALYSRIVKLMDVDPTITPDEALTNARVEIDELVTPDVSKLARIIWTLNGKTGFKVFPVTNESELIKFSAGPHLSPFRGEVEVKYLRTSLEPIRLFNELFKPVRGVRSTVPSWIAVYLALNNAAEVVLD
ncbi:MAG: DNA primase small subunit domain-containing protein [Zestosphaera sp.]